MECRLHLPPYFRGLRMIELAISPRSIDFTIFGIAAPKGSKRGFVVDHKDGTRGVALVESAGERLKDWQGQVNSVMQEVALTEVPMLEGPLSLYVVFHLPRPKSAPKSRIYPDRKPDLDKLIRVIGDACTQTGLVHDDAQFIRIGAVKVYVSGDGKPRAEVEIREVVG